jgi:hypothetical protein
MLIGFLTAFQFYIRRPDWPAPLAENQRPLYLFLLNKWYFDEIYDFLFVRPALWLGGFLWKRGDGGDDRRGDQRGRHGDRAVLHPPRGAGAVGLHLHLCLRDGGGDRGAHHLDDDRRGGRVMDNLISIITFLPLVAALILAFFLGATTRPRSATPSGSR